MNERNEDDGRLALHPLAGRLSESQKDEVEALIATVGSAASIWKWVRDPRNESVVKELAAMLLVERFRARKRAEARKVERAEIARRVQEMVADQEAKSAEQREAEALAFRERDAQREANWLRYLQGKAEAEKKRRAEVKREIVDSIVAFHGVSEADITIQQFDLVAVGFPVEGLRFGASADEHKESFDRLLVDAAWREEWGFKKKRSDAMDAARRSDDDRWGFFRGVTLAMEKYKAELRAEWSAELLASTFRVDGVTVTWGDATAMQHQRRAEKLRAHAEGTMETAALHIQAARHIESSNAVNLSMATGVLVDA